MAKKMHQEKLRGVQARLNFEGVNRGRPESPEYRNSEENTVFTRLYGKVKENKTSSVKPLTRIKHPTLHAEDTLESEDSEEETVNPIKENKNQALKNTTCRHPWLCQITKEIHKRSDGDSSHQAKRRELKEDFMQRFKSESRHVKGAPECMRISGFMHGITNPGLIKHLHNNIIKSVDEMMRETGNRKQSFDRKPDFRNQQRIERRRDKFTILTKSLKEILEIDKGKFKTPPPMTTQVEKQNNKKFCELHGEVRHSMDGCMHLKRKIEELIKAEKLSHVIKELKQNSGKVKAKVAKKGEALGKDKALAILMVQPW
ncbi:hypothetical protein Tco_0666821 [Tanacetum coccineum]